MSIRRYFPLFLILSAALVLVSCQSGGNQNSSEPAQENRMDSDQPADASRPFRAVATSAISVDLAWDPIEGATSYRIENSFADSEWFEIALVSGEITSYEDFLTPSNMELNYRLTPLMGDQDGKALNLTITTPEEVPNPFTVVATLEELDSNTLDIGLTDFDASTFDPSTFDPSSLDTSGVDTENLDLSSLMPEPVSDIQRIGPEGGILSITGKNGVTYTLTIPPEALTFSTIFELTPVSNIEGYPFTGGYFGAVQIQPEGIYFEVPATLRFDYPEDTPADQLSEPDLVQVAFAFEEGGNEFHLTPFAPDNFDTVYHDPRASGKLSSPTKQGAQSQAVNVIYSTAVGIGATTVPEARSHAASYPTTSPTRNAEQKAAAAKVDDELAPLELDPLTEDQKQKIKERQDQASRRSEEIQTELLMAGDMNEVLDFGLADLYAFYLSGDMEHLSEQGYDDLWETAVTAIMGYLEPVDCPSPQATAIQEVVWRLRKSQSSFDGQLQFYFEKKYGKDGKDLLNELDATRSCKVFFEIISTVTHTTKTVFESTQELTVHAKFPLQWRHDGRSFLYGGGSIDYINPPSIRGKCYVIAYSDLKNTSLVIEKMYPVFDSEGNLVDWQIRHYETRGMIETFEQTCKDEDNKDIKMKGDMSGRVSDVWAGYLNTSTLSSGTALGREEWKYQSLAAGVIAYWHKEMSYSNTDLRDTSNSEIWLKENSGN